MTASQNVLLVGGGKMGGAMLRGWMVRGLAADNVRVIEPFEAAAEELRSELSVSVLDGPDALDSGFTPDVVVFAVKPQGMDEIVPLYAGIGAGGPVVLSIAAGRNIAFFECALGNSTPIVRTMPNTPAAVGRGITAACANRQVSEEQKTTCQSLLEAVGDVVWIDDEGQIDAVTAVSGSGPAYVFYLIECMAAAGEAQGLAPEIAEKLARATVAGSGELARQSADAAGTLRENVTSRGGTTAAALEVLMADNGMKPLMSEAIAAAARRSRELAG